MGVFDASTSPPKERYAVSNHNVHKLIQSGAFDDQLTAILRRGARSLLPQAVEAEVAEFVANMAPCADIRDSRCGPMTQGKSVPCETGSPDVGAGRLHPGYWPSR